MLQTACLCCQQHSVILCTSLNKSLFPRLPLSPCHTACVQLAQGGVSWAVNARQAEALARAHAALGSMVSSVREGLPMDFWTIDLRAALLALGEVSGDDATEEVLDNIFSRFCIGK